MITDAAKSASSLYTQPKYASKSLLPDYYETSSNGPALQLKRADLGETGKVMTLGSVTTGNSMRDWMDPPGSCSSPRRLRAGPLCSLCSPVCVNTNVLSPLTLIPLELHHPNIVCIELAHIVFHPTLPAKANHMRDGQPLESPDCL